MRFFCVIFCCFIACGSVIPSENSEHTLPEPMFSSYIPDPPAEVPLDKRLSVPVSQCVVEGSDPPEKTPPGILLSQEMVMRAARLKIAYDELRGFYEVDIRTMDREREVYERHLKAADDEIIDWRNKAQRSWWERHGAQVMLGVGIVLGVGVTIGVAAAIDGVTDVVE
jgi:hypothetical protein